MEDILKDIYNSILNDNKLRFIFKAAHKSKNNRIKLSNLLFEINKIQTTLNNLRNDVFFKVFIMEGEYFKVIKDTEKYILVELTVKGVELAKALIYDETNLKTNIIPFQLKKTSINIVLKIIKGVLILLFFIGIILLLIPLFYKEYRELMLYIIAVVGLIYVILEYHSKKSKL